MLTSGMIKSLLFKLSLPSFVKEGDIPLFYCDPTDTEALDLYEFSASSSRIPVIWVWIYSFGSDFISDLTSKWGSILSIIGDVTDDFKFKDCLIWEISIC